MESAARVAARYRDDPRVRTLCQTVVPVAGLLAQAGVTLTEAEYRALAVLGAAPPEIVDALLLTADRFGRLEVDVAVSPDERAALLARLGLFGVRLAIGLAHDGVVHDSTELARELVARSGVTELRRVLGSQFAARRDALKARSGLLALQAALRTPELAGDTALRMEMERVLAGAHEFQEMALLDALRRGVVTFRADELPDVERLLGGAGARSPSGSGSPPMPVPRRSTPRCGPRWPAGRPGPRARCRHGSSRTRRGSSSAPARGSSPAPRAEPAPRHPGASRVRRCCRAPRARRSLRSRVTGGP